MIEKSRNNKILEEEISNLNNQIKNLEFQNKNHVIKRKNWKKKKENKFIILYMRLKKLF